jgi:hypothetical protein
VDVPDVHVETESRVDVRVDRGGTAQTIRLGFAVPAGLVVTPRVFMLEPGTVPVVPLVVMNAGATATSRLPLVAIAEYDTPDGHVTSTAVAIVEIGPPPSHARTLVLAGLVGLFVVTWAAMLVAIRRRRRMRQSV